MGGPFWWQACRRMLVTRHLHQTLCTLSLLRVGTRMVIRRHSDSRFARSVPAVVVLAIATTGCVPLLFDDSCGPESRFEITRSSLRDEAGTDLGEAVFSLNERRREEDPRSFSLVLMGPRCGPNGGPLRDHVMAVALFEAAGALRFDLPVVAPSLYGEEIISPNGGPLDAPTFSILRSAMLDGQLRLHIETSPGAPTVGDVSFPAASPGDWDRAHCS